METNFETSIKNNLKKYGFLVKKYVIPSIPGHPDLVIKKDRVSLEIEVKENWHLSSAQKAYAVENYQVGIFIYYVKKSGSIINFNSIINEIENIPGINFNSVNEFCLYLNAHYKFLAKGQYY